ncbi:hypothetical protein M404DRAFT_22049 [Pisolithus tinctorius Marx 270]|uniref:Uncharacterized protein n=1 Tax=Pisolithus tinctorius Marx 270 TaxID=870435 RepID=A0A0C3JK77_PISTI|nr:hypothetical protein M404DRAFT_22049 [Pisolithus tinctorius Marx 270]
MSGMGTCDCIKGGPLLGCKIIRVQVVMSSLPGEDVFSTRYDIWGFMFGPTSGPCCLSVRVSGHDNIWISGTQYLFAADVEVSTTRVEVGERLYVVFFDLARHQTQRQNATYVFVRVCAAHLMLVNIRVEDDLQDILHVLLVLASRFPAIGGSMVSGELSSL